MKRVHFDRRITTNIHDFGTAVNETGTVRTLTPIEFLCHDYTKYGELTEKTKHILFKPSKWFADNKEIRDEVLAKLKVAEEREMSEPVIPLPKVLATQDNGERIILTMNDYPAFECPKDYFNNPDLAVVHKYLYHMAHRLHVSAEFEGGDHQFVNYTFSLRNGLQAELKSISTDTPADKLHTMIQYKLKEMAFHFYEKITTPFERRVLSLLLDERSIVIPFMTINALPALITMVAFDNIVVYHNHAERDLSYYYLIANELHNRLQDYLANNPV